MKLRVHQYFAAGLFLAASSMHAATVNISLGQAAQNFILTGLGPLGSGNGTYSIQQGACSASAGLTTCTLSGAITGSNNPSFASGTYSFVTTYATSDLLPIQGESQNPTSNSFFYDFLASDVNMTLNLSGTPSGNVSEPMVTNGNFDPGTGFGFGYVNYVCSGLPAATPCSQANVGQFSGATTTGPVTMSASFTIPDQSATPEPGSIALTGIAALVGAGYWLRRKRVA